MARIAFIMDDMFEDSEFRVPFERLQGAGHDVVIVGIEADKELTGKKGQEKVTTQVPADAVSADDFDALVIPGGYSPDKIRTDPDMVGLTRDMVFAGKVVAAVCHGPWMLAEADVLDGREVTSWPSIRTDLVNAGANWTDREVVVDDNVITSRKPDDLDAFSEEILVALEERAEEQAAGRGTETEQEPEAEQAPEAPERRPPV